MGLLFILQMIYEYGEPWWNDTDRGKQKNSEKNLAHASMVRSRQLTVSAMARPYMFLTSQAFANVRNLEEYLTMFSHSTVHIPKV
jgi:hypothetical protein